MKKIIIAASSIALSVMWSNQALASSISAGYQSMSISGVSGSFSGFGFGGNLDLNDNIFLGFSTSGVNATVSGEKLKLTSNTYSIGYKAALSDNVEASVALGRLSSTGAVGSYAHTQSTTVYGASLAVRPSDKVELGIGFVDATDSSYNIDTVFTATYTLNEQIDLTAALSNASDSDSYTLGVRYNF